MKGFPGVPKETSGFSSPAFCVLLVMWWRRRWVHLSLHTYLIIVISPSSLATNMDTVLSGWSTTLSNSVQTASMNVSHFILGINFCTANGCSYVAKLNKAINKAEPSTKSCRKWSAKSLAVASLWHQESHGKQKKDGEIPAWALHARTASRSWGKSSCDSPCRNVISHLQGLQHPVHQSASVFSLAFTQQVVRWDPPSDGILPSISWGLAKHVVLGGKPWKWLRHVEVQKLLVGSFALPEHRDCFFNCILSGRMCY